MLVAIAVAGAFFALNIYTIKNLPGAGDLYCSIGDAYTPTNVLFSAIISLSAGVMAAGIYQLFQIRKTVAVLKSSSTTVLGLVTGFFTAFCTACTLPFITVFGASISLTFISEYEIEFKLLSLVLMFLGLYLLNNQLKGCEVCAK